MTVFERRNSDSAKLMKTSKHLKSDIFFFYLPCLKFLFVVSLSTFFIYSTYAFRSIPTYPLPISRRIPLFKSPQVGHSIHLSKPNDILRQGLKFDHDKKIEFDRNAIRSKPLVGTGRKLIVSLLLGEAILGVVTSWLGYFFKISPFRNITGFGMKTIVFGFISTIPLLLLGKWIDNSGNQKMVELSRDTQLFVLSIFGSQKRVLNVFVLGSLLALSAAFSEELLFRGLILPLLLGATENQVLALMISSILFGFGHSPTYTTVLVIESVLGLYFGILFLVTQNLAFPMIAHFFYDCITYIQVHIKVTRQFSRIESSTNSMNAMMQARPEISKNIEKLQQQYSLSATFLERCGAVFCYLDLDGNGGIDEDELRLGYKTFGRRLSRRQVKEIMAKADSDHSGYLDIGQFITLMVQDSLKNEKNGLMAYLTKQAKETKHFHFKKNGDEKFGI